MHRLQRRDFLYGMGASLGTVAFNALLQAEKKTEPKQQNLIDGPPLAPRDPHLKPRAKACIFLASDDASFTTGCDFTVDGGGSIRS